MRDKQGINNTAFNVYTLFKLFCSIFLVINLFACSSRQSPAPVVTVYGSTPLNQQTQNTINAREYTVQAGETLYSIAWRANSDVRQIAKLNNISPPYNIFPNQKLILVANNQGKSPQASKNVGSSKKQTKNSNPTSIQVVKKPIASSNKQAYGKNVSKKKTEEEQFEKTNFSQKISRWKWPVKGKIIDRFSSKAQGNKGIDIGGRRGTNIRATAGGKVVYAGSALRGYGKLVIVKHNDDYLSAYAHNDKILVKEQQLVKAGDIVAKMGDTDAQRVMLHFEVRFRGKSVDPLKYLPKK
ncbi:peptidoglycan DD-metalloendopeptidase family protein [Colwellia sp. MSW7]|uniref:Peptidoglycan DD-metalloendopeptidase family protein n=1 Tax=Colwellia maritima TaxID=2912588 RepID=A0ABS9WZE8_9GAMM|nr:peptidoglycan DD-metalloendopeptidase family protein [Colwellia maritima]MCI2283306.1 peptidoglycan DD-metalloendopeptidase family protein [Colwellia maritima]